VQVGDGAYSGAGAVIRSDVPAGALAISLAKQRNAEGWVLANRPGSVSAALAEAARATPTSSSTPASTEEG
jgi:bifunctional UDP-N-acetylglucosamine pyrophosphorylase/glucosamine-1-phosphate N-acetyltransferase